MKNLILFFKLLGIFVLLMTMEGCFKRGANREAEVANCNVHDKKEGLCNASIRKDGRRCKYDKVSGNCRADNGCTAKSMR